MLHPPLLFQKAASGARKQLLKKMEERNVSISNAKNRWNFLKKQSWTAPGGGASGEEGEEKPDTASGDGQLEHQQQPQQKEGEEPKAGGKG